MKTVMIRKFFQMVFVGNDRKKLNIYTATVLGGNGSDIREETDAKIENYISDLSALQNFCMEFGFVVTGNDGNDVLSIISEDVTEKERGFLLQEDCIRQVWGEQCAVLYNNQSELEKKYNEFIESDEDKEPEGPLLALSQKKVLWIEDCNKQQEWGMRAIAISGGFSSESYEWKKGIKKQAGQKIHSYDGEEKAFYCISAPEGQKLNKGIELLNWVKTTIRFKHRLSDQNLNFCIKKADDTAFVAPDFTWYFSPPVKSFINYESSSAEARWKRKDHKKDTCGYHESCECPIKPSAVAPFASKRYDNIINPVANKTTVHFQRWTEDEMIGYRQKYRIAAKNIFALPKDFDAVRELNIFIDTTDEHSRGNRQYILGIFISFALAFGIDKTRLGDAQRYFPFEKLFLADTWWLFMIISMTLNLLIRPVRSIRKRRYIYWRMVNIIASFLWIFSVFCVDKSVYLTRIYRIYFGEPMIRWISLDIDYFVIPQAVFLLILFSNFIYVLKNIIKYHDPILSSLFGEDIL